MQYKQGPLLEESHYYPFGLTMAGISDKAIKTNYVENKYRYDGGTELQSKEFSDGSGLELYETSFRSFDPQLGRFSQVDPLADKYHFCSTYQYSGNNPVQYSDPSGAYRQFSMTSSPFSSGVAETQGLVGTWNLENWLSTNATGETGGPPSSDGQTSGGNGNSNPNWTYEVLYEQIYVQQIVVDGQSMTEVTLSMQQFQSFDVTDIDPDE